MRETNIENGKALVQVIDGIVMPVTRLQPLNLY